MIVDPATAASTDISISVPTDQSVPENQWLTFGSGTGNAITINADPTAEAEVTVSADSAQSSADDSNQLALGSTDGLTMIAGSGDGDTTETFTGAVSDINAALDGLEFMSPNAGQAQLSVVATLLDDSGNPTGDPAAVSTTITVREAPYFNDYLGLWLQDQPQYSAAYDENEGGDDNIYGTQVTQLLNQSAGPIGNADNGGPVPGIAITGIDSQNGTWQYSQDGGGIASDGSTDWTDIDAGALSDTNALLLDSSVYLRFEPNAGFFGDIDDAVTFRLWDETTGTSMDYADVSDNGGVTAFSADTATAALRIDPLVSISGSGGNYTISTTSDVSTALDVSGTAGWGGGVNLPFTVVIPAGQSSTTLNLSTMAGLDIDWGGISVLTVQLVGPGGAPGDYSPVGYDYQLDLSADSVSTTFTTSTDNQYGSYSQTGGVTAYSQTGNTIQVTLEAAYATGMTWSTVDGTAIAGTDYESAGDSVTAGGSETVTITLDNLAAPGDSGFFIMTSNSGSGIYSYYPITIQTVGPQLLADSNNDGRIDAEADAAANATAIANNSGGVLVNPDGGNVAGLTGWQMIAAGQLVEVDMAVNYASGGSVTLTEQGDTGDFVVWTDPTLTTQLVLTGSGATWPVASAPTQFWVEAPETSSTSDGEPPSSSQPAITFTLSMQDSSGSQSGQAAPAKLRVQAAAILDAKIVTDNPKNATFNEPMITWLSGTPAQLEQGAYVPLDNEDLDNNGTPDDLQATPAATDNLLPIEIRNVNAAAIEQGGWFTLGAGNSATTKLPPSVRIWLNNGTSENPVFEQVTNITQLYPSSNIYVEAVGTKQGNSFQPVDLSLSLFWHADATQRPVKLSTLKINEFSIGGPRDVPDQTTYQYNANGAQGTFAVGGLVGTTPVGTGMQKGQVETVTWAAEPGGAWGKVEFTPQGSAYTWAAHIAVVGINIGTLTVNASGTPAQITGQARVDSTNLWATNSTLPLSAFRYGLTPAMTADLTVTSIVGPTRPGVAAPFGVNHIQMGFVQTATINQDQLTYSDGSTQTTGIAAGSTLIDVVNKIVNPASTFTTRDVKPNPDYNPTMLPWYDPLGVTFTGPSKTYTTFQSTGQANVNGPTVFHTSDLPSYNGFSLDNRNAVPTRLDLSWSFTTMFVVHTIDTDSTFASSTDPALATAFANMKTTNYTPSLNGNAYTIRTQGTWSFNGSGTFSGGNFFGQNSVGQPANAGTWRAIVGTTGVFSGTVTTPNAPLPKSLFVPSATAPILNNLLP